MPGKMWSVADDNLPFEALRWAGNWVAVLLCPSGHVAQSSKRGHSEICYQIDTNL